MKFAVKQRLMTLSLATLPSAFSVALQTASVFLRLRVNPKPSYRKKVDPMIQNNDMVSFAHDIRNILTPALMSAEYLETLNPSGHKRHTDRIFKAIDKTVEICNAALKASAPCALSVFDAVSLSSVLTDAVELAIPHPNGGLTVSINVLGEDWVGLDGHALCRMVFNLVRNASNALKGQADAKITLDATAMGGLLILSVNDNGPGLPAAVVEQLNSKFTAPIVHAARRCFGLAATASLAESLKGELMLRASSAQGTEFAMVIPYTACA
ncbi:MAG: sensor histidine kinase [Maricaulaceae bacterium]